MTRTKAKFRTFGCHFLLTQTYWLWESLVPFDVDMTSVFWQDTSGFWTNRTYARIFLIKLWWMISWLRFSDSLEQSAHIFYRLVLDQKSTCAYRSLFSIRVKLFFLFSMHFTRETISLLNNHQLTLNRNWSSNPCREILQVNLYLYLIVRRKSQSTISIIKKYIDNQLVEVLTIINDQKHSFDYYLTLVADFHHQHRANVTKSKKSLDRWVNPKTREWQSRRRKKNQQFMVIEANRFLLTAAVKNHWQMDSRDADNLNFLCAT